MQQGAALIGAARKAQFATAIEYARGEQTVALTATVGRSVFELVDRDGFPIRSETRDYLFLAAELVLGGQLTTPQDGDVIREAGDGAVYVHEVMAPGDEPNWRFSDAGRSLLRVHTKQTDVE